uniref:Ras association domain-containing protein 5 n=1 Tax=Mus spicilegus TaxID=10103 RepID=A0A8C6HZ49_MUSSI
MVPVTPSLGARPKEELLIRRQLKMREGPDEEVVAACFSTVTVRLQRFFQRLPRSHELSEKLRTPQRLCSKALAHDCKFTCHSECRSLIQLDCRQKGGPALDRRSPESTLTPTLNQNVCKAVEETQHPPTIQEIKQKIDSYNSREKHCLGMKLSEDGTYTGFIKVHLKLRRPVTVPAGIRPQSIYDAIKEVNPAATTDKRTSFYLPLDAIKQLHISSTTTVSEVIQGLLKKFMVVDNPQKFALFKRIHKDGQVLFQKLSIADYPLYLRLLAGPDTDVLSFVLKENETGEVEWDAFSIPELQNFLTILEKEEQDKIHQLQKKYNKFRQKLEEALRESQGKPG